MTIDVSHPLRVSKAAVRELIDKLTEISEVMDD